jgi:hypothetical protein
LRATKKAGGERALNESIGQLLTKVIRILIELDIPWLQLVTHYPVHQGSSPTMDKFEAKMKQAGLNQAAIDAFKVNYEQLVEGATGMVSFQLRQVLMVLDFSHLQMEYIT